MASPELVACDRARRADGGGGVWLDRPLGIIVGNDIHARGDRQRAYDLEPCRQHDRLATRGNRPPQVDEA